MAGSEERDVILGERGTATSRPWSARSAPQCRAAVPALPVSEPATSLRCRVADIDAASLEEGGGAISTPISCHCSYARPKQR